MPKINPITQHIAVGTFLGIVLLPTILLVFLFIFLSIVFLIFGDPNSKSSDYPPAYTNAK